MGHLNTHKHVSAKPVPNVIRGCLIYFLMGYDRNDRNDKGNGKSYMRKIGRGLQISCHSCHLCHWGGWVSIGCFRKVDEENLICISYRLT